MPVTDIDVLRSLAGHITQLTTTAELSQTLGGPEDSILAIVGRLADRGLVSRTPVFGGRTHVALTDAGRQWLLEGSRRGRERTLGQEGEPASGFGNDWGNVYGGPSPDTPGRIYENVSSGELQRYLLEDTLKAGGSIVYDVAPPEPAPEFYTRLIAAAKELADRGHLEMTPVEGPGGRLRLTLTRAGRPIAEKYLAATERPRRERAGESSDAAEAIPAPTLLEQVRTQLKDAAFVGPMDGLSVIADLDQVPPAVVAEVIAALDALHRAWGGGGLTIESQTVGTMADVLEVA